MIQTPTATIERNIQLSPARLAEWLREGKEPFILDVRPEAEREDWSIPESVHLDLYDELKTGHSETLETMGLPGDRSVVTVCGAGNTSLTAARQLREKGVEAYSLEGGMKAWNFAWDTAEMKLDESLSLLQIRRPAKGCLSYIIGSGDEAAVIDASLDPGVYTDLARENGWTIRYAIDTHLHADFVSRTRDLAEATGAAHLLYHGADTEFSFTPAEDGQIIKVGNTSLKVLHTPGHTPESISVLIGDNAVFTGDTLFTDGVGRPDLKADREQAMRKAGDLYDSLQRLLALDKAVRVFPAHVADSVRIGEPVINSTIGDLSERIELLSLPKGLFVRESVSRIPPAPSNFRTISRLNRKGSLDGHRPEDLEAGANRCAVG